MLRKFSPNFSDRRRRRARRFGGWQGKRLEAIVLHLRVRQPFVFGDVPAKAFDIVHAGETLQVRPEVVSDLTEAIEGLVIDEDRRGEIVFEA